MKVSLSSIMAGIYIHIPFCKQACHYCDFHFSTQTDVRHQLIQSMAREITLRPDYLQNEEIRTIYFGGGTPSILTIPEINLILEPIHKLFSLTPQPEITLEANPDDLTIEKLTAFKKLGINRLSIGIQSFQDEVLKFLNRVHHASAAVESVLLAREAGFENISIDLIYAIPGQTHEAWRDNIRKAIALNPEHISAYALTIEQKTVFGKWMAHGKLTPADEEIAAAQLEILMDDLQAAGYRQYEISNFSKPNFQSQHNSSYWKQEKYLGIGPSAHSYDKVSRQHNVYNNHLYIQSLENGVLPFEREVLSAEDHINEYLLTTLRTEWGADLEKLKKEFHYDLPAMHPQYLVNLIDKKLGIVENNCLKLTRNGRLLADKISSDLFLVS
jgi:oxygen-independent coproporphyrinogen-3 oxidase